MKLQLNVRGVHVPYGGMYDIVDRLTGQRIRGTTFNQLIDDAVRKRIANGTPIGLGFEDELESWVCQDYPAECVNRDTDAVPRRTMNLNDIVVGTRVMLSFKAAGSPVVSQDEAERRAAICAKCPINNPFKKPCTGICEELLSMVRWITGNHSTRNDPNLHSCSICGCFLQAAVWLPVDIQTRPLSDEQRAQFLAMQKTHNCWKNP